MQQPTQQSKRVTAYDRKLKELSNRLVRADSRGNGSAESEREYGIALNAYLKHLEKG